VIKNVYQATSKEKQLENLRKKIEVAQKLESALINGTEQEFVYGQVKDLCWKTANRRLSRRTFSFKEKIVNDVIDRIYNNIKSGCSTICSEYRIEREIITSAKNINKRRIQTTQIDERRM
jgi:hypothetical protein